MIVAKISLPLFSLATVLFIARVSGVQELGKYTFVVTYFSVFHFMSSLWMYELLTREVAKNRSQAHILFDDILKIGIVSSFIFFAIMVYAVKFFNYSDDVYYAVIVIGLALFPSAVISANESVFMGYEKYHFITTSNIIENLIKTILSIIIVLLDLGIVALATVFLLCRFINVMIQHRIIVIEFFRPKLSWGFKMSRDIIGVVPLFLMMYTVAILYTRADIILLSLLKSDTDVGLYSVAMRILTITMILPDSFVSAIYPAFSRAFHSNTIEKSVYTKTIKYPFIFSLLIALGVTCFSSLLISILFGSNYNESIYPLQILIWSLPPYVISAILGRYLLAGKGERYAFRSISISLIITIILNYYLITLYGFLGASIAHLLASLSNLAINMYYIYRYIFPLEFKELILKPLLPLFISGILFLFIKDYNVFIVTFIVIISFMASIFFFKILNLSDIDQIKRLAKK